MSEPFNNTAETAISPSKDLVSLLMDYEDGILGPDETTQLFQELIDSGWVWQLQGHYGRTAREFLLSGRCLPAIIPPAGMKEDTNA